jgi:small-conductance mechanosensitive channel
MLDPQSAFYNVLESLIVVVLAGVAGEGLIYLLRRSETRAEAGFASVRLVRQLIRIVWVGLAILLVLTIWGVSSDILTATVVGIVALVVSLGLQSTVSNMISGVFLLQDGAIRPGDYIEHFAIKGVVVRVALRNTWVKTDTGQMVVVGNTKLADGPTLNRDLMARYEAEHSAGVTSKLTPWHRRSSRPPEPTTQSK